MQEDIDNSYNEHSNTSTEIANSLVEKNFDNALDYAELGLDSSVSNEVLKEIPIVKTVVGVAKTGLKIKEIFFCKKILSFLKQFHSGMLPDDKMTEFRVKFEDDKKYQEQVLEQVMIYNDRFSRVEKSKIFANLFLAHLNGKFDWEALMSLTECLEKLNILGINDFLSEMESQPEPFHKGHQLATDEPGFLIAAGLGYQWGTHFYVTGHGIYLHFYGLKGDINYAMPKREENQTQ